MVVFDLESRVNLLSRLLDPSVIWILIPVGALLIPISAVVMSALKEMQRAHYKHVERMAMIESGLDPDRVADFEEQQQPVEEYV